jgi:bifunctional non-homologous end joining protein LigD
VYGDFDLAAGAARTTPIPYGSLSGHRRRYPVGVTEIHAEVDGRTLRISNLDKVLYPATGTTKGEVLSYYAQVAPVLLPHLADRAVTRIRWPHGVQDMSFFEKNAPNGAPSWLRTAKVPTTGSRTASKEAGTLTFPIVDGLAALTYLVNLASLELHVHQWTVNKQGRPRNPNRLVIDLDPGEPAGLPQCCEVALLVREKLAERDLPAYPVTSGSKGLHLYAPLPGRLNPDGTTALAREIAEELQAARPGLVTATMTKSRRSGKVFLDWSQNAGSKTTISPYSLRGREKPMVATPRTWEEVEAGADDELALEQCRFEEVLERVEEHGDLFLA